MMKRLPSLCAFALAALLGACGGGGEAEFGFGSNPPAATGLLIDDPHLITTLTAAQIDAGTAANGLQALSGPARCDVKVVALNYSTAGPKGESTNASGVLLAPAGACSTRAPLLAYAKGTDLRKPRTLANPQDPETFLLAAMYAAQGYAVVASDYLGYARSAFPYHPYLHADSEARSVLDSIRAARHATATVGLSLSGKVMLAGYSQGGHSAMAAQRAAERDFSAEFDVVAGAHMAGPYNLSGMLKLPQAIVGYQFFAPFVVTSYKKVYGDVYSDVNQAFKPPYAATIENLLPSPTLDATTLVSTGALPGANGESPNQVRDALFQPAFLADVRTNPANPLALDARKNDLFGWSPRALTLLCGGAGDPTVPAAVNMVALKADFDARNVNTVTLVDVDPQIQAAYGPGGQAPTDPGSSAYAAYYGAYHGSLEPPFCHARARALFDTKR